MLDLLWWPSLACLVLTGIHAYLGLHVLARGVIFVDLALAQVAALGATVALLAGHAVGSDAAYYYSLAFTVGGASILAATRERRDAVPQEAIIGIVYAVAAALSVLVLDRVPQGGEQIKQLLVGSILSVTGPDVSRVAGLYAAIGLFHWLARRPFLALSLGGDVPHARLWDFVFYFTFGLVVTSSVRVAGVLLVFSYLVVPAVVGAWLASTIAGRLVLGWAVGVIVSALGLGASWTLDLPTGATVVATFGVVLAVIALARGALALGRRLSREGPRALAGVAAVVGTALALVGVALAAFPEADHYWLDGLERLVPSVQTTFLTHGQRATRADSLEAIARGEAEARRLRALQADVQWGTRELAPEQRERLRQFVTSREELLAGDRLVLRTLRGKARQAQRFALGVPVTGIGLSLAAWGWRLGRCPRGA